MTVLRDSSCRGAERSTILSSDGFRTSACMGKEEEWDMA